MANRFYVQPQKNPMWDMINMGMQLYGMRQKQALGEKELALKGEEAEATKTYRQQQLGESQAQTSIAQQGFDLKKEASYTTNKMPMTTWLKTEVKALEFAETRGIDQKLITPILDELRADVEAGGTPRSGFVKVTANQERLFRPVIKAEEKKLEKLMSDGYSSDSPEVTKVTENIAILRDNKFAGALYPRAAAADWANRQASKRKIEETRAGKAQYGAPTKDQYGNIVQRADTGKVSKVSGPTRPGRLYPTKEGYQPYEGALGKSAPTTAKQQGTVLKTAQELVKAKKDALESGTKISQDILSGIRDSLKGSEYELVDESTPKVVKKRLGVDALSKDTPAQENYVIRKKAGTAGTTKAATPKTTTTNAPPMDLLKEGVQTTFKNGQVWTLKNGKAVQIR